MTGLEVLRHIGVVQGWHWVTAEEASWLLKIADIFEHPDVYTKKLQDEISFLEEEVERLCKKLPPRKARKKRKTKRK